MDITSALKSEVFRPVATLVVPGALAIGPYIVVAQYYLPTITKFWQDHDGPFVAIVVVLVLAAGLILEDLGALIEIGVDAIVSKNDPRHQKDWHRYLALKLKDEIIGQRYLRTLVVRLKFELSMAPALTSMFFGLAWIQQIYAPWTTKSFVTLSFFFVVLVTYLLCEAYLSARNLGSVRRDILIAQATSAAVPE